MTVLHATTKARDLLTAAATLTVAVALFIMPVLVNVCGATVVCDEMGTRTVPISEEEEVKHACTIGFLLIDHATAPHVATGTPIPHDERIEASVHGEVAVPPPKAMA